MNHTTTFTNGRIALTRDLIFGVCVLAEHGWMPVKSLTDKERRIVLDALDNNPTCPQDFVDALKD